MVEELSIIDFRMSIEMASVGSSDSWFVSRPFEGLAIFAFDNRQSRN